MSKSQLCVLCDAKFSEWGNNPYPLANSGKCCNTCNTTRVIPQRLYKLKEAERKEERDLIIKLLQMNLVQK